MKAKHFIAATLLGAVLPLQAAFAKEGDIVVVNDTVITEKQVSHFIAKQPRQTSFEQSIAEMINIELLVQQATNDKFLNDETLKLELERTRSAIIAAEYLKKKIAEQKITNEDLNKHYQENYVKGSKDKEYKARHILLKTEQEAIDLIAQIKAGADFSEMAKEHSTGPSGKNGGDLGWFKKDTMVKPFADATAAMTKGEVSTKPVQTQFGWHIISLDDTRTEAVPPFNTVEREIRTQLSAAFVSDLIRSLRDKAKIELAK